MHSELTKAWHAEMDKLPTTSRLVASRVKSVKLNSTSNELSNYFNDKSCGSELPVQFKTTPDKPMQYLENVDKIGSLGCDKTKYPKYQDGKYCCLDSKSTVQEKLDYINRVLVDFFNITGKDVIRIITKIQYYIETRNELIAELRKQGIKYDYDSVIYELLPSSYTSLDDWYNKLLTTAQVEELEGMKFRFEKEIFKYDDETFYKGYDAIKLYIAKYKELRQLLISKNKTEKVVSDDDVYDDVVYIPVILPTGYTSLDQWYEIAYKKARLTYLNNTYFTNKYFDNKKYTNKKIEANITTIEEDIAKRNALIADLTRLGIEYTDNIDNTKLQALLDTIEKIKNPNKTTGGRKSKKRKRRRKRKSKKTIKHK